MYPKALLPQQHFKKIQNINDIKEGYLIHFTETKDNKDENGKVKLECVVRQTDHLRDYSNNLLGIFEIDHIYLYIQGDQKEDFNSLWEEGVEVSSPKHPKDFANNYDRGFFFLFISDIQSHKVKYNDGAEEVECTILHTPTKSNFWHVSLRWLHEEHGDVNDWESRSKRRRVLTSAKAFIVEKATFQQPSYNKWSESIYT